MDRRNTTIWRGGLSELLGSDEPLEVPPSAAEPAGARPFDTQSLDTSSHADATAGPRESSPQPLAAWKPHPTASSGTLIMRHGLAAPSRWHDVRGAAGTATRVLPIERLLKPQAAPATQGDGAIAPPRRISARQLRLALLLVCFGGLIALLYDQTAEQAEQPPPAAQAPAQHLTPVAGPPPVAVAAHPVSAPPAEPARGPSAQLARAAVDALAFGDARQAARLYEQLAAARPGQPVFAIAARTLQARATGP